MLGEGGGGVVTSRREAARRPTASRAPDAGLFRIARAGPPAGGGVDEHRDGCALARQQESGRNLRSAGTPLPARGCSGPQTGAAPLPSDGRGRGGVGGGA